MRRRKKASVLSLPSSRLLVNCLHAAVPETPQPEEVYPPGHPKAKADTSQFVRLKYFLADVTNEEIDNSASQWF
jgi:hypothetical protein